MTPRLLVSLDAPARPVRVRALGADGAQVWTAIIRPCDLHRFEVPDGGGLLLCDDVTENERATPPA